MAGEPDQHMTRPVPSRSRATSTTRWSRIACARRRWSAAASWAVSRRGSRRSTRCGTPSKSETRYNADPHDLIDAVVDFATARGRDPGDLSFASRAGRPFPARPTCAENHYGPVPADHRLACWANRPTSASGGSIPTRTRNSPGSIVEPGDPHSA